jgi:hypothetical protein
VVDVVEAGRTVVVDVEGTVVDGTASVVEVTDAALVVDAASSAPPPSRTNAFQPAMARTTTTATTIERVRFDTPSR